MAGVGKQRLPAEGGSHSTWCTNCCGNCGGDPVGTRRPRFPSVVCHRVPHMSSLWTPGGERPVGREPTEPAHATERPAAGARPAAAAAPAQPSEEELATQLDELRKQLSETPAEVVIANHAFGL